MLGSRMDVAASRPGPAGCRNQPLAEATPAGRGERRAAPIAPDPGKSKTGLFSGVEAQEFGMTYAWLRSVAGVTGCRVCPQHFLRGTMALHR